MGGGKFLLTNRYITKYKHSQAFISSTKNLKKEQYEYLEKSIIPTHHFQKSLTKLAIPKLEDSINRYLASLKPLLTEAQYDSTVKSAKSFQNNEAAQLDKEIRELDAKDPHGNYINDAWFDMYLSSRDPILLNYNPFIIFRHDPNPGQMNQAIRASNLLISSARFAKSLRQNQLKPEIFHLDPVKSDTLLFQRLMRLIPESVAFYGAYMFNAYPLDMSQYFRLFNSSRIPKKGKDILVSSEKKKSYSSH
jgi:carnitine O-palmitoyltransferase 2